MATTDDYGLVTGDSVCYTEEHHKWLVTAARWPSNMMPRRALDGTVISTSEQTVTVRWRHDADPRTHFASNLELLVAQGSKKESP